MGDDQQGRLLDGCVALNITIADERVALLTAYQTLLLRWNQTYNLIGERTQADIASVHILDSLSVLPYIRGQRVLDVGTGAGLPGMILAIAAPELHVTLLDSAMKRCRFCRQASIELGLRNVSVSHCRVQDFSASQRYSTVVSRAFSSLRTLIAATSHLLKDGGRVIAMKGVLPAELDGPEASGDNTTVVPVDVPGLNAERHLVIVDQPRAVDD